MPRENFMHEIISNELATQDNTRREVLALPDVETLHERSVDDIGKVLANVVRSRRNLIKLEWTLGGPIVVTYNDNPLNQLKD